MQKIHTVTDPQKNWLAAVWRDPVGSKLIAVALLGICTAIWAKLNTDAGPKFVQTHEQLAYWFIVVLFIITLLGLGLLTSISRSRTDSASAQPTLQPRVVLLSANVTQANPTDQRTYPVKIHAELRNDSQSCVDVSIAAFIPGAVTLEKFVTNVFQLKIDRTWLPAHDGAERIAVLPGQMFRLWLGVEKARFTQADQVTRLLGSAGKLVLMVNGGRCEFPL